MVGSVERGKHSSHATAWVQGYRQKPHTHTCLPYTEAMPDALPCSYLPTHFGNVPLHSHSVNPLRAYSSVLYLF